MSTIFLSYRSKDEDLAAALKDELRKYGHEALLDRDKSAGGGDWRAEMVSALKESDGLVALYTQNTLDKPDFIASEIGMARAFRETLKDMFIIPVCFGKIDIPNYINDIQMEDAASPAEAAEKIDRTIRRFLDQKAGKKRTSFPKIFISHRHVNKQVAAALTGLLEAAFDVRPEDIRCTSVPPYTLPTGGHTSALLRQELSQAEVVLGLISPDTMESRYVLVELGAAWGQEVHIFPLLFAGAKDTHVPAPLSELHCISLEKGVDCSKLIQELKQVTSLKSQTGNDIKVTQNIENLTKAARKKTSS